MTDRDTYYATAQSWADERVESERRARRLAWIVAGVAGAIALVLALIVAMLLPLKTVQPYVVTVDRQTGAVEMATTVADGRLTQNEAVIEAELANYVRIRETFDATDLRTNFRRVQLLSAPDVRTAYVAAMARNGFPNIPFERVRMLIGMGGDKLLPSAIGVANDSEQGKAIDKDRKRIFKSEYLPHLHPTPGAANLIARLQADGIELVVATSGQIDEVNALLDLVGVRSQLTDIASASDAEQSKPDPDIVGAALKKIGLPADQVRLIGDTPYDVEAGKRAGIGVVALRSGGWDDAALEGAVAVFDDPADALTRYAETVG